VIDMVAVVSRRCDGASAGGCPSHTALVGRPVASPKMID
jgi:hypothetical protein